MSRIVQRNDGFAGRSSELALYSDTVMLTTQRALGPGFLKPFGRGLIRIFTAPGVYSWVPPAGVKRARFRVVGGGGGGCGGTLLGATKGGAGAGGGFAYGAFDITPLVALALTVGAPGLGGRMGAGQTNPTTGGTSSVASLISATGGANGIDFTANTFSIGGIGIGGDFQAKGGRGSPFGGGGAAGSQLGDGGDGHIGGGGILHSAMSNGGASVFGMGTDDGAPNILGITGLNVSSAVYRDNPLAQPILFPFEMFVGNGGRWKGTYGITKDGGPGAGGGAGQSGGATLTDRQGGAGGDGGGGGAGYHDAGSSLGGGKGGIGGGGGGNQLADDNAIGGDGGPGLVIVEY